MVRLEISLLGPIRCTLDGEPAGGFGYDKVRALLFYLLVENGGPHRREALAGLLWPEQDEAAARHSLSQALSTLRAALDDRSIESPLILVTRDTIEINRAAAYDLDVDDFLTLIAACEEHTHEHPDDCSPCARRLKQAVERYRGAFLADFNLAGSEPFREWQLTTQEALQRRLTWALARLIAIHRRRNEPERAIGFARRWTDLDPLNEAAQRALIGALAESGDRSGALRQFEHCRTLLAAELDVAPEPETEALGRSITQAGATDKPRSTGRSRAYRPTAPVGTLIGREYELDQLARLLHDPTHRLITLAGPGGIGKTRLALGLAEQEARRFADGACLVPLVSLSSPAQLPHVIAGQLGVAFYGPEEPKDQLIAALRSSELLLILDNFEHLLEGAEFVSALLAAVPGLYVVATSRERLNLYGEQVFHLAALRLPPAYVSDQLEQYSAVRLFVYRARQADPIRTFNADDYRQIARICTLASGLPLAIELAAAWTPVLSCAEIAREIENNLDFLRTELRDIPERHRSMRAAFDHSWQLLDDRDRDVFARLTLFRGGIARAAAVAVAGADLPVLASLVAKSFITHDAAGRYGVHELLRQYGERALRDRGREYVRTRQDHLGYFVDLVARSEARLKGPEIESGLAEIETELENIRIAWRWAVEQRLGRELSICSRTLWLFFEITGRFDEWRNLFEAAINALDARHDSAQETAYAELLTGYAACLTRLGAFETADRALEQSIVILRRYALPAQLAFALNIAALVAHTNDAFEREQALLRESLTLFQQAGDRWGSAYSLNDLGMVTHLLGDTAEARRLLLESLAISTASGDQRGVAFALHNLGTLDYQTGDYPAAEHWHRQSLQTRQAIGNVWGIATSLTQLGIVAEAQGNRKTAERWCTEALRIAADLHALPLATDVLVELARLLALEGNTARAAHIIELVLAHPASGAAATSQARMLRAELPASENRQPTKPARSIEALIQAMLAEYDDRAAAATDTTQGVDYARPRAATIGPAASARI
jgi:predicted ATPase/DNA-binding SARP family transcriptional activator